MSAPGSGGPDPRVVLYVDGGLASDEAARFEALLAADPALQRAVERAHALRSLVRSALPRRRAPTACEAVLARVRHARDADPVGRLLGALPRHRAPDGIRQAVLLGFRTERSRALAPPPAAPQNVRAVRASLPRLAAAAALLMAAGGLFAQTQTQGRPSAALRSDLVFDFAVARADGSIPPALRPDGFRLRFAGDRP